jgi:Zn-dependent peptidase ImmA (M78 family)
VADISQPLLSLGLSAEQIAARTKLSVDRVKSILAGASPKIAELRALSSGLRLPTRYFASKARAALNENLQLQFRSTTKSVGSFNPTVERVAAFVDAALSILPERQDPPTLVSSQAAEPSPAAARSMAEEMRQLINADETEPLYDLPLRLDRMPGVVTSVIKESRFEGISISSGNYLFIFVSPRFPARMLFSLAHEAGHAAAGHLRPGQALFEGASAIGNYRKSYLSERFADAFAGHLLIPDEAVVGFVSVTRDQLNIPRHTALGDIEILLLARFFGVSFEVAANRCEGVGLLPQGGGFSIAAHLRQYHKSPEKRAEELGLPNRPALSFPALGSSLAIATNAAIERGDISIGWAADRLGVSVSEILGSHSKRSE